MSCDLAPTMGFSPDVGHGFTAEDDQPGTGGVVLLSDDLWNSRYQRDLSVIGRQVTVNTVTRTIVGVMPPGFKFPTNQQLWVPLASMTSKEPRNNRGLLTFARMKPGVTPARALQETTSIAARLAAQYP